MRVDKIASHYSYSSPDIVCPFNLLDKDCFGDLTDKLILMIVFALWEVLYLLHVLFLLPGIWTHSVGESLVS